MKKILVCLVIIGCLTTALCLPVSAATSKEVDFVVDVKDNVVTVEVNTNFDCGGLQGVLKYDPEKINYGSIDVADSIAEVNGAADTVKNTAGETKIALVGDVNSGTIGEWAKITYSTNKETPVLFDFASLKVFSANSEKLSDVQIFVVMRGDANNDGLVNLKDLVRVKKISAGVTEVVSGKEKNIDVDSNGKFEDALDLAKLRINLLNK